MKTRYFKARFVLIYLLWKVINFHEWKGGQKLALHTVEITAMLWLTPFKITNPTRILTMDSLAGKLQIYHFTEAIVKSTKLLGSTVLLNSCRINEDWKV